MTFCRRKKGGSGHARHACYTQGYRQCTPNQITADFRERDRAGAPESTLIRYGSQGQGWPSGYTFCWGGGGTYHGRGHCCGQGLRGGVEQWAGSRCGQVAYFRGWNFGQDLGVNSGQGIGGEAIGRVLRQTIGMLYGVDLWTGSRDRAVGGV